ncbi:MAG: glycosyltransferase family 2 protein [Hyphomonadaceae bacterium]
MYSQRVRDELPPTVGVIVVTFESRRHFSRLKAALEAQDMPFELIVLDNASSSEQRPRPADLPAHARLVQSDRNLGFAAGNNRAAEMLSTDFIVLLNPDAFPAPDWLSALVQAASDPRVASVGSTQLAAEEPDRYDGLGDCYHACGLPWRGGYGHPRTTPPPQGEPFSACAAGVLYRASAWRETGGFDESFFCYCEDVDLGFRLRLLGWRNIQASGAVIEHVGGGSSGKRSDFAVMHGTRNRTWTFVKNMPGVLFWLLLPAHILMVSLFMFISPFRGTGAATWRGTLTAVSGIGPQLRARARVQRSRKAPIADIAAALTWSPFPVISRSPVLRAPKLP